MYDNSLKYVFVYEMYQLGTKVQCLFYVRLKKGQTNMLMLHLK